jgi:hypothetical protein
MPHYVMDWSGEAEQKVGLVTMTTEVFQWLVVIGLAVIIALKIVRG